MESFRYIYVGTYTDYNMEDREKSKGIYVLKLNMETGELNHCFAVEGADNPSYLTINKDKTHLYAVNEIDSFQNYETGAISCYQIDKISGELTLVDQKSSLGKHPCHITLRDNKQVFAANYTSGSISTYLLEDNKISAQSDLRQHTGSSVNVDRQKEPHAHSCILSPDQNYIFAADLGTDQIMSYQINKDGTLKPASVPYYSAIPGSGPRYGEFHKTLDCLYVINELTADISVLSYHSADGSFELIQTITTMVSPEKIVELDNTGSDLHITPDGKFLYASNRGEDSLAIYRINQEDGTLERITNVPTGGKTPRNFTIDRSGTYLLVANQNSDNIVVFQIDPQTGLLHPKSTLSTPIPVCLCIL